MSFSSVEHAGLSEVPATAWNNNGTTPIVAADVGSPVKVTDATGRSVILATAGVDFIGVVGGINVSANVVSVIQEPGSCVSVACNTDADAPVVNGWVVANGSGGVKKSATKTNWQCTYVSGAVCEIWRS